MRGSFSDGRASESTFRIASSTFRLRSALARDDHLPVGADELPFSRAQVALDGIEELVQLRVTAAGACHGECRALPEVVVVDLGHGCPEAFVELRLRRLHV